MPLISAPMAALLDLDHSLFIQLVLFLATVIALNALVFKPLFRVMDLRRERTEGTRDKATALEQAGQEQEREYQQLYTSITDEGAARRADAKAEASAREQQVQAAAAAEAVEVRDAGLDEIERARVTADAELEAEITSLRKIIIEQVSR
jgi:F-type H+-transporting ATPase subunit b